MVDNSIVLDMVDTISKALNEGEVKDFPIHETSITHEVVNILREKGYQVEPPKRTVVKDYINVCNKNNIKYVCRCKDCRYYICVSSRCGYYNTEMSAATLACDNIE